MTNARILYPTFAAALVLAGACSLMGSSPQLRRAELIWPDPNTGFTTAISLHVVTRAPDGSHHDSEGQANRGGTVPALCRSLQGALRADGCEASYRHADPTAEPKIRSTHQIVEFPAGWTFVSTRIELHNTDESAGDAEPKLTVGLYSN